MSDSVQQMLEQRLSSMGLADYVADIRRYMLLLQRWNRAFNLVAKADDVTLLDRHILDSLAAREFIHDGPCLDVGSGAGLPGLILAVTMPATQWVLLDSNGKKTRFCEQAAHELGLANVRVVRQRIADYEPAQCYATIISRAYAKAVDFVNVTRHLLCDAGRILAMKGKIDAREKTDAQHTGLRFEIKSIHAPGQSGQRHIMIFS